MRGVIAAIVIGTTFLGGAAQAQTVVRGKDKTIYKHVTTVDVSTVDISGKGEKPTELFTIAPHFPKFSTLIRLRGDFTPELSKSVERL